MRIAITGASGFLGRHLVAASRAAGHDPIAVVRRPERVADPDVAVAKADLSDLGALSQALEGADVLVANAALSPGHARPSDEDYTTANLLGAKNHLEAALLAGVSRVVWISTVAVYRTRLLRRVDESGLLRTPDTRFDWSHLTTDPRYSRTKAEAERLAWAMAASNPLELTVLRPGPIYGPGDPKLTARYAASVQRRVVFAPTVAVPHVHARDVADAAVRAASLQASVGRAYNVTGESVSPFHILRTWSRLAGTGCRVVPVPLPLRIAFDDTRAMQELRFRSRSIEEGIHSMLGTYGDQGRS